MTLDASKDFQRGLWNRKLWGVITMGLAQLQHWNWTEILLKRGPCRFSWCKKLHFADNRKAYRMSMTQSEGSEGGMGKTVCQEDKGKHFSLLMFYFLFRPGRANTSWAVVIQTRISSESRALQGCNISPCGFGCLKHNSHLLCEVY